MVLRKLVKARKFILYCTTIAISLLGFYNSWNTEWTISVEFSKEKQSDITFVWLLAYARTGSSFTGELLAVEPQVFYLFEPSLKIWEIKSKMDFNQSNENMYQLYNCNKAALNGLYGPWERFHFRTLPYGNMISSRIHNSKTATQSPNENFHFSLPPMDIKKPMRRSLDNKIVGHKAIIEEAETLCCNSNVRLIKTIRYRMDAVIAFSKMFPLLKIKIVHLLRDPRAILNSVGKLIADFENMEVNSSKVLCENMRRDMLLSQNLPTHSYFRVQYESLMQNIPETVSSVYDFIGIPFTDLVIKYIKDHTNSLSSNVDSYSTYRGKDFNPNSWKTKMDINKINKIETECEDVIKELGYPLHEDF